MLVSSSSFAPAGSKGFFVLEGVNGAGKSTLQKKLAEYLTQCGIDTILTREPGATPIGNEIRSLVLETKAGTPAALTEIFLFAADRAEHVEKIIAPALKERKAVISDRYYYSTIAFQGYGRGLDRETIQSVNTVAIAGVTPDFVLLLDLDPAEGLRRTSTRTGQEGTDAFEKEKLSFHERLRKGFLEIAKSSKEAFLIVDASKSPEEIFNFVKPLVDRWREGLRR
jgi:dTMP kinase